MKQKLTNAILTLLIIVLISNIAYSEMLIATQNTQNTNTTLSDNFIINTYGITKDFIITSPNKEINFCTCETFVDKLTIQNTGSVKETYKIIFDKEISKNYDMYITLNAGEKTIIPNYIDLGCEEKSKEMNTYIESSNGIAKILTQNIKSNVCNNINITNVQTPLNITPCQKTNTTFILQNPSKYSEDYIIETEKFDIIQNTTKILVNLKSLESRKVIIDHQITCDKYGKYNSLIKIDALNSGLYAEIPVKINISKDYDYSLNILEKNNLCLEKNETFTFKIKNEENFENAYDLILSKNNYFNLPNKTITLKPFEEKIISLSQKKQLEKTNITLELKTKSKLGEIEKTKTFIISIKNCYDFDLKLNQNEICKDDNSITITLKNLGEKRQEFKLSSNTNLVNITQNNITLFPNEQRTITLNLTYSNNYNFLIYISQENNTLNRQKSFNITRVNDEKCYELKLNTPSIVELKNTIFIQNITLNNTGLKDGFYELYTDNTNLTEFIEKNVTIRKDNSRKTFLKMNLKNVNSNHNVTLYAKNKETNATYKKTIFIQKKEDTFFTNISKKLDSIKNLIKQNIKPIIIIILSLILIAIIIVVVTLLIVIKRNNDDKKKKLIVSFYKKRK